MFQLVFVCAIPEDCAEEYEVLCVSAGVCGVLYLRFLQEEDEGFVVFSCWCLCVLYLRLCRKNMRFCVF